MQRKEEYMVIWNDRVIKNQFLCPECKIRLFDGSGKIDFDSVSYEIKNYPYVLRCGNCNTLLANIIKVVHKKKGD